MKIQNCHLKALISLTDKTDTRYYVNRIHVDGNVAYSSNGYVALRVPVSGTELAVKTDFVADKAEIERKKFELSNKQDKVKTKMLPLIYVDCNMLPVATDKYPPIGTNFDVAKDQQNILNVSYDLDNLIAILQAIKTSCTEKTRTVTLHIGNVNRPMLISVRESCVTGIIVPARF